MLLLVVPTAHFPETHLQPFGESTKGDHLPSLATRGALELKKRRLLKEKPLFLLYQMAGEGGGLSAIIRRHAEGVKGKRHPGEQEGRGTMATRVPTQLPAWRILFDSFRPEFFSRCAIVNSKNQFIRWDGPTMTFPPVQGSPGERERPHGEACEGCRHW